MILFHLAPQNIRVDLKQFPYQMSEPAQPADLIFFTSTLMMGARILQSLTCECLLRVSLLFAWLRLCQDQCAQPEELADTNMPTVTKTC